MNALLKALSAQCCKAHTVLALLLVATLPTSSLAQYSLTVNSAPAVGTGGTVYRFYVNMTDPTDRMSAVFGNDQASLIINTPAGAFNSTFNSSWNASGLNPAFLPVFPDMADDTYATIGLTGPASTSGIAGAADPSIVEDVNQPVTPYFLTPGATNLEASTLTGSSWYILNTAANGLPDANLQVLIAQVTTTGSISGQINYQVFPLGVGADQIQKSVSFNGAGTFGGSEGCTDPNACNYSSSASDDDGSCEFATCVGCTDVAACNYNEDATIAANETCVFCDCGASASGYLLVVESSPAVAVEGATTYRFKIQMANAGDQMSAVFGVESTPIHVLVPDGAFNSTYNTSWSASSINPAFLSAFPELMDDTYATIGLEGPASSGLAGAEDPTLVQDTEQPLTPFFLENGQTEMLVNTVTGASWFCLNTATNTFPDENNEVLVMQITTTGAVSGNINVQILPEGVTGIGNDIQKTFNFNGVGAYAAVGDGNACGCMDETACNYDSDANYDDGSCLTLDCAGDCGGTANLDECGVCDGPGAIYECGCSDIPAGDCDCDGNVLDECGVCGGSGIAEGACDCDGNVLDECGVCGGAGIPAGDCDCNGNQFDALGNCGGSCLADIDGDGVCDDNGEDACTDEDACNFSSAENDACDFCSCAGGAASPVGLVLETQAEGLANGMTSYRLYVTFDEAADMLSALMGKQGQALRLETTTSFYQDPASEHDSYVVLGSGTPALQGAAGPWEAFNAGGNLVWDSPVGGGWSMANGNGIAAGGDLRVLVAQLTTDGEITAALQAQILNAGAPNGAETHGLLIQGVGDNDPSNNICGCTDLQAFNYDPNAEYDDGSCIDVVEGCMDSEACNYDASVNTDDGSCLTLDCAGDCGGAAILDACGVCDGDGTSCLGCTDEASCNYDASATIDDGSCLYLDALGVCGGDCTADVDADGTCDDVDDCVGAYDDCD
ncbi:MAG: hypothetical protein O2990_06455, partial [Bacteroidetes bacterium]|nr:hypothetical protein [Bacteroidota bacterium]